MAYRPFILLGVFLCGALFLRAQDLADAAKVEFFDQKVYSILKENCFKCHGVEKKL